MALYGGFGFVSTAKAAPRAASTGPASPKAQGHLPAVILSPVSKPRCEPAPKTATGQITPLKISYARYLLCDERSEKIAGLLPEKATACVNPLQLKVVGVDSLDLCFGSDLTLATPKTRKRADNCSQWKRTTNEGLP
jgi:hypothetical protein